MLVLLAVVFPLKFEVINMNNIKYFILDTREQIQVSPIFTKPLFV